MTTQERIENIASLGCDMHANYSVKTRIRELLLDEIEACAKTAENVPGIYGNWIPEEIRKRKELL